MIRQLAATALANLPAVGVVAAFALTADLARVTIFANPGVSPVTPTGSPWDALVTTTGAVAVAGMFLFYLSRREEKGEVLAKETGALLKLTLDRGEEMQKRSDSMRQMFITHNQAISDRFAAVAEEAVRAIVSVEARLEAQAKAMDEMRAEVRRQNHTGGEA